MYAKAARELTGAGEDASRRAEVLADIQRKLHERRPERDQFILSFMERFYYTNEYTKDSKLVRYVLTSLLREYQPSTGTENLTIEHLMPQSRLAQGESFETVGSIGNLLLVSEEINGRLGNKEFNRKREILASEGLGYDIGGVLDIEVWGRDSIRSRTKLLAERAYDTVWKLPV